MSPLIVGVLSVSYPPTTDGAIDGVQLAIPDSKLPFNKSSVATDGAAKNNPTTAKATFLYGVNFILFHSLFG